MAEKNVRIRLFKDNSRYKGDLFVSVNGVNYKIRRGVEVYFITSIRGKEKQSTRDNHEAINRDDRCPHCRCGERSAVKSAISTLPGWEKCPRPGFL